MQTEQQALFTQPSPYVTFQDLMEFSDRIESHIDAKFAAAEQRSVSAKQWVITQTVQLLAVLGVFLSIHFH